MTDSHTSADTSGSVDTNDKEEDRSDGDVDDLITQTARADLAEAQWRRAAADLDNLQKRFAREVARERTVERIRVTKQWVAMLDDLDRSLSYGGEPDSTAASVDGLRAIVTNAVASIAALGYPRFGDVGDRFDAGLHEVISTVPASDAHPAGTIAAVVKPGYGTREDLLRPASVVVAREADQ